MFIFSCAQSLSYVFGDSMHSSLQIDIFYTGISCLVVLWVPLLSDHALFSAHVFLSQMYKIDMSLVRSIRSEYSPTAILTC